MRALQSTRPNVGAELARTWYSRTVDVIRAVYLGRIPLGVDSLHNHPGQVEEDARMADRQGRKLADAVWDGDRAKVEKLLAAGASPQSRNDVSSALRGAVCTCRPDLVELLLRHGADVEDGNGGRGRDEDDDQDNDNDNKEDDEDDDKGGDDDR